MASIYERRVSSEEAREGYIMVLKDHLSFFPPIGQPFELHDGDTRAQATVEARDCTCRGPEKPHQHYFIRRTGLINGEIVRIARAASGYELETNQPSP